MPDVSSNPHAPEADSRGPRTTSLLLQRVCHRVGYVASDDDGFTLLEVVVSFVLFAIVAAGATVGINSALASSHTSQQRIDAANIAQQDLAIDVAAYRTGTMPRSTSYRKALTNESFLVTRTVAFNVANAVACTPGASFTVHVSVAQAQTGKFLAQTDTVIAC